MITKEYKSTYYLKYIFTEFSLGKLHPLDPLTPEEITTARDIVVKRAKSLSFDELYFVSITNKEPPKELYLK